MMAIALRNKKIIFIFFLSYLFLIIGTIPLTISITPSLATAMMVGNLAYALLMSVLLSSITFFYIKSKIRKQKPLSPLSILIFIFSLFIVWFFSGVVYEVSEAFLLFGEIELAGHKKLMYLVFYGFANDLVTVLLSLLFVLIVTSPIEIYKKRRRK